jgi:hypothetical protein
MPVASGRSKLVRSWVVVITEDPTQLSAITEKNGK